VVEVGGHGRRNPARVETGGRGGGPFGRDEAGRQRGGDDEDDGKKKDEAVAPAALPAARPRVAV
jgi:hypothetical protein